ncbi:MAG TPA: 4-hydroxyphenylpyruvate dioxygenase [Bryobacteraceae bacterium]|nr:4-hydroxyphenylpyruvate dioxygenase [Bryobacteraceae bacterium]
MQILAERETASIKDFLPLHGIDHVEFYVGNAKQAAHYYRSAFGFRLTAYSGPETGCRNRAAYLLEQDKIRFVFSTAIHTEHLISRHVQRHGDGVKAIAFTVDDAEKAWRETTKRGAESVQEPLRLSDDDGEAKLASIATYGETVHTFVERGNYRGVFLPGYVPVNTEDRVSRSAGLLHIDHMVGNVALGDMNKYVDFYRNVMGFDLYQTFDDKDISTDYSALMSKVMSNGNGCIKFPINEPAEGKRKSQIEEYLEFYGGPGVQHIAMATDDIIGTVTKLRDQGVDFLRVPPAYYTELKGRVGAIDEPVETLSQLGILVDRDDEGYLLQIFTKPVQDRPTVFYEIIQRKGARSFGKGNFKALFEAIEREQEARGNL